MPAFLLFIVFLVLKLTGIVAWSWLWITAPLWIPLGFFLVIVFVGMFVGTATVLSKQRFASKASGTYFTRPLVGA